MAIRILIIDDHKLFREGLKSLLNRRDIEVLATVDDGIKGIELAQKLLPDIVLLDMRMPNMDGISVLKQLKARESSISVVMLTTSNSETDLLEALKNGANGYLVKDMDPDELVTSLRDVNAGKRVVAPNLTSSLVRFIQGDDDPVLDQGPFSQMTPRESEIVKLMAEGQGNKLIGRNLGITEGTVKLHVKSILRKLEVHSRVEVAIMYIEHNNKSIDRDKPE